MIAQTLLALAAGAAPARFALIVTYNGGLGLDRAPLHYADDDGAKYREVLGALGEPGGTLLLTEFDADSQKLFPELAASTPAPTRANVETAADALARKVADAKRGGRPTELTFVYAGHGDVDHGRGYLVLQDGRFDGDALQALLQKVSADTSHVILDSCNSFFVLSPRGPGRRFATPQDVAERLSHELSNVGLFLSTNAEAEVYEWSELQSGVFSHAVRSGLLGAADANGDGVVTYEELAAFVDRATRAIANPLFRPKLFARGPGGNNGAPLADLRGSPLAKLRIDERSSVRLSLRDRDGLRWVDVHTEGGSPVELRLPPRLAGAFVERTVDGAVQELALPEAPGPTTALAALTAADAPPAGRGADEFLRMLFAQPFGPQAYAEYERDKQSEPAPAFGISATEKARMQLVLQEIGDQGKRERMAGGTIALVEGGIFAAYGALTLSQSSWPGFQAGVGAGALGAGGLVVLMSPLFFLKTSEQEKVTQRFLGDVDRSPEEAYERADSDLQKLDARIRSEKARSIALLWVAAGIFAGGTVLEATLSSSGGSQGQASVGLLPYIGATTAALSAGRALLLMLTEDPTIKLIHLWQQDPDRLEITGLGVMPVDHGAAIGLSGRF